MEKSEHKVLVPGGKVHAVSCGRANGSPLIGLHGGPGFSHNYLEPLFGLSDAHQVILYDQLGCGDSERPEDPALWTIERHVDELFAVIDHFGLKDVQLLGHSWGTILAVEAYVRKPSIFKSLILGSPCIDVPLWARDAMDLRTKLPKHHVEALNRGEANRDLMSSEYLAATQEYYRRFVYGMETFPDCLKRSNAKAGGDVYRAMWGVNEFFINGSLAPYDGKKHLAGIKAPVWYFTGRNDEATPSATKIYSDLTPKSALTIFEKSSHHPHLTETESFLGDLRRFLTAVDAGSEFKPSSSSDKGSWFRRLISNSGLG